MNTAVCLCMHVHKYAFQWRHHVFLVFIARPNTFCMAKRACVYLMPTKNRFQSSKSFRLVCKIIWFRCRPLLFCTSYQQYWLVVINWIPFVFVPTVCLLSMKISNTKQWVNSQMIWVDTITQYTEPRAFQILMKEDKSGVIASRVHLCLWKLRPWVTKWRHASLPPISTLLSIFTPRQNKDLTKNNSSLD